MVEDSESDQLGQSREKSPAPLAAAGNESAASFAGRPDGTPTPGSTLVDPLAEALRLIGLADAAGLQVRLLGGLAFHAAAPEWTARIARDGRDIDLATRSRDRKAFSQLMESSGYLADRQYNALYGHKQLYFMDPIGGVRWMS